MDKIFKKISEELSIREAQVEATVKLIDEGNTIPFIARYRKEVTGNLSDEQLRDLGERLNYLRNLETRKEEVKKLAKENNKIIGFAYCYTLLRPAGKTMFYLHSIGMLPNYQDKGYGSKLLSFIKEYSKEIGCSEMFLITDKGNPRACHVYEKLGGKNDYKDEIVYVYDYEKGDK